MTRRGASRLASGWILAATVVPLGACVAGPEGGTAGVPTARSTPPAISTPTPQVGAPLAAFFHLRALPPTASKPTAIRIERADDAAAGRTFDVAAGESILAVDAIGPGVYRVVLDGVPCEGAMTLIEEAETDARILVSRDRRTLTVDGVHPAGGGHEGASLAGRVSDEFIGRATVTVVSRDTPRQPVPDTLAVDESGWFSFPSLQPGRYRLRLDVDGVTVDVRDVELGPGSSEIVSFVGA